MDAMKMAAIGMQNDLLRLNSVSQNLANVSTSGYKREIAITKSFSSYVNGLVATEEMSSEGNKPLIGDSVIDPSSGTMRFTSNPLDVAIEGDGYFEVMTESGIAFTRQGSLKTDLRGRLVTNQGYPLSGVGGEINLSGTSISIDRNGEVKQGDRVVGQLKIVHFSDPQAMVSLGSGLLGQGSAKIADANKTSSVRVGYIENSNVNSPQEMVRLSETVRHFEAMQKIAQGYDDLMEKTIRKLGEF